MKQAITSAKKTNSRWFRINLWIHRWISLVIVLPFTILSITGIILIFHEEIDHALGVEPMALHSSLQQQRPLANSLATAQNAYPDEHIISTGYDPEHHPGVLLIGMAKPEQSFEQARWLFADIGSATLIQQPSERDTLTGFLLELHANWFLGFIGQLIGALIAFLVFLSLISGLVVYAPYVKKFFFGIIRTGKGQRLLQLDLHNLIGSAILGWALVVTLTGFLLGFGTVAIGLWQMTELKALQDKYHHVSPINLTLSIDDIYAAAQKGEVGWHPTTVFYPKTEYSTQGHYMVLLQGDEGLNEKMLKVALVNAATGQVDTVEELPAYLKAILLSQPLHFGNYGGMPLKILWSLCTLLSLFITLNGAWLWWAKRQQKSLKGANNATVE
ncbi:PepSY-associated TM helix domain-containing protein [Acinetobacter sp. YK3]|uniref:PepSY-associated TM helix domain-containing protein n=1 Tax=Acinetobacter sp. YK3 TaxID=1860097 RepID=UPI00084BDBF2|nr:PepSY-associated TM helix domain-containing protein [Acinetobacter sp. YK3]OEC87786.1 iron-regulated protein [Acinetobacter sp. YK3]